MEVLSTQEALTQITTIEGCIGASVVDSSSGMMLGSTGNGAFDLEIAAAGNTEVVRAKRKTMASLGLGDTIEDILITLDEQYHIIRPLKKNPSLFLYAVLLKDRANLAMARHKLRDVEGSLKV